MSTLPQSGDSPAQEPIGIDVPPTEVADVDLSRAEVTDVGGSRAEGASIDLPPTQVTDVDLSRAEVTGGALSGQDVADTEPPARDLVGVDLRGREVIDVDLRGARFVRTDLSGAVMRGVGITGADIDDPWLLEDDASLLVNGVDVAPYVEAELNRRFPGRSERRATDPDGLRAAWAAVERTWAATLVRVAALPAGSVDISVDGEWSFAQTLRHLVMATDTWLGKAILEFEQPYHPIGQPHVEYETDGYDMTVFATERPPFDEVLAVRSGRMAMVRDFLAGVTPERLAAPRTHPWAPDRTVTVLHCLHTILGEEWEHHRYAVRDLDAIEAGSQA